jgi:hypothetical protein
MVEIPFSNRFANCKLRQPVPHPISRTDLLQIRVFQLSTIAVTLLMVSACPIIVWET